LQQSVLADRHFNSQKIQQRNKRSGSYWTDCGGGYGNALMRCEKLAAEGARNGFVSMEAFEKTYGVIFSKDDNIDSGPTENYRSGKAIQ